MRWIVDAMNVVGTRPDGWWQDRRGAMTRLVEQLERWALAEGHRFTVVLEQPMSPPIRSSVLEIAQPARGGRDSADDEIVRLVREDDSPAEITVVTSDRALAHRVHDLGAASRPAGGFRNLIESVGR